AVALGQRLADPRDVRTRNVPDARWIAKTVLVALIHDILARFDAEDRRCVRAAAERQHRARPAGLAALFETIFAVQNVGEHDRWNGVDGLYPHFVEHLRL